MKKPYEQTITLLATALQHLLVVTCRTRRNCQKIFVAPKPFLSVLTISLGLGSIMNNIYICTYDNFTPHIPYFLFFPVYFGLTFVDLDLVLLLTCADWMRSRATSNFDRFALSRLSKCNFADIYIFYVLLDIMMQCITLILDFLCCRKYFFLISSLYIVW